MCQAESPLPTSPSADSRGGTTSGGDAPAVGAGPADSASCTVLPCQNPVLAGMVVEVSFDSGIKVSYAKTTISAPHWRVGDAVQDGSGSKRAAVYLIESKGGSHRMLVKVTITQAQNISGAGQLLGTLDDLEMEGSCPLAIGDHVVPVTIRRLPNTIKRYKGDISWRLQTPAVGSVTLTNVTRVELFTVLDQPASFYSAREGVWTEALRFLCERAGAAGKSTASEACRAIAEYCHGSHGLRYDTNGGRSFYGVDGHGGVFQLGSYLQAASAVVNCYDQAGAVQALAGAVGAPTEWYFLSPFGYINPTNLIGIGNCNNPFYTMTGSAPVVAADDPRRTSFGNHAFCGLASKVLDACAGPHVATETKAQYVTASIDARPAIYGPPRLPRPGTVADIVTPAGLTRVV